ncbi:MAG: hemerythrin domain-containing protein [Dehalococcoidia bacterium]
MKRAPELIPLSWDHHHGLVLARRIREEVDGPPESVSALYSDLLAFWSAGLLPHFRVEGECLLARLLRHVGEGAPEVQRVLDDHLGLAGLVATMRDTTDDEVRREALRQFGTRLHDHIRWEEDVLFQRTQELLDAGEMAALGEDIRAYVPALIPAPGGGTAARPTAIPS